MLIDPLKVWKVKLVTSSGSKGYYISLQYLCCNNIKNNKITGINKVLIHLSIHPSNNNNNNKN